MQQNLCLYRVSGIDQMNTTFVEGVILYLQCSTSFHFHFPGNPVSNSFHSSEEENHLIKPGKGSLCNDTEWMGKAV